MTPLQQLRSERDRIAKEHEAARQQWNAKPEKRKQLNQTIAALETERQEIADQIEEAMFGGMDGDMPSQSIEI